MIYDHRCASCGNETEAVNRIAERRTNAPMCCGERMPIIIKQAPMGYVDRDVRYICPVTNSEVTTRNQRNEIMARNGLVDANDLQQSYSHRKAERKEHLDIINQKAPEDLTRAMEGQFKQKQDEFINSQ